MKNVSKVLLLLVVCALQSCYWGMGEVDGPYSPQYSQFRPLQMSRQNLEQSVSVKPPQTLHNPGKIYSYGNYILVNEKFEGVHIIDNQNPASPQNIAFLKIPGCIDIAVKDNVLYADNAIDLVAVDLADPQNPVVTKRVPNIFPALNAPDELVVDPQYLSEDQTETIIYNWVKI